MALTPKANFQFKKEPPEAVKSFFANKGLKPSFDYRDIWRNEHGLNFTVAKAMEMDILTDLRDAVKLSLDHGIPYSQFAKNITPILKKKGWWGKAHMIDPLTGDLITAQLGSPRRLKVIYRANIRSARAAGQFQRANATARALPFFIYELGPSENHRPEHQKLNGLILPVDDKFWDNFLPPNGWGCKCRVRQISAVEAKSRGYTGSGAPDIKLVDWQNKRTGEIEKIPLGIDPGWNSNPGKSRLINLDRFLAGKLESQPVNLARIASRDLLSSWKFKEMQAGNFKGQIPIAVLPKILKDELTSKSQLLLFSQYTAKKGLKKHQDLKPDDYLKIQNMLDHGEVIKQDKNNLIIQMQDSDQKYWRAVIKKTQNRQEVFLSTFHRISKYDRQNRLNKGDILRK